MATFPTRETDIIALAQSVIHGLANLGNVFTKSPHDHGEIQAKLNAVQGQRDKVITLQAQLSEATTAKNHAITDLSDCLKAVLAYVQHAATDDSQLAQFGWSGRRTATAQTAPGQCRVLEIVRQGDGWVSLDWKEPADGGKPAFYAIEFRELPDGDWRPAGNAVESEATLTNLPMGKTLQFRVYAANKAGQGPVSNTVEVKL